MSIAGSPGPYLSLTDDAFALVRHAANEMSRPSRHSASTGRIVTGAIRASTSPSQWPEEAALLRMISVVESYVDAVSINRMNELTNRSDIIIARLLDDFELATSRTWEDRMKAYDKHHGFSLKSMSGWANVDAGIQVRNCLAHGLGQLTALQRKKTKLSSIVSVIDVTVSDNRMHLGRNTISKLANGCIEFLADVDSKFAP